MVIKLEKIPQEERLFMLAWVMYLIIKILSATFYRKYFPEHLNFYLVCICVLPLIFYELVNLKRSYRELLGLMICILFIFLTMRLRFMGGGGTDIALMFTFIYCGRRVSFRRIAKVTIVVTLICLGWVILSSFLGIIPNYVEYGTRVRQYIGFRYALFGPAFMFNVTLLFLYIKQQTISYKLIIVLAICNWLLYVWTDSRLSFGLTMISLLFALMGKYKWDYFNQKHWWYWAVIFSFVICAVISLCCTVMYSGDNLILKSINDFFGGRLSLGKSSIMQYGVRLWGQNIEWIGNGLDRYGQKAVGSYLYVDCLYIQLLQHYGVIFTSAIIILITLMMVGLYRQHQNYLLILFGFIAVHCMLDDLSWQLYYNTFWLLIGIMLMRRKDNTFISDLQSSNGRR